MSGLMKNRALAALTALLLVAGLLAAFAGPAAGAEGEHSTPYSGPALVYYDDSVNASTLGARLGLTVTQDYESFGMVDSITAAQTERLEFNGAAVEPLEDLTIIYLRYASIDTKKGEPSLPPGLINPGTGDNWYLAQFVGPIKEEWLTQLQSTGEVVGYYANFTYLAYLTEAARQAVSTWVNVRWVGPFHPAYRLEPGLADGQFYVTFFPGRGGSATVDKLSQLGLTVEWWEEDSAIVQGTLTQAQEAAKLVEVFYVEQYLAPETSNNVARTIIKSNVVHNKGIIGAQDQTIAITDTGIWWLHQDFSQFQPNKITAFIDLVGDSQASNGDGHGHGTHVAGSALGDAPNAGVYLTYNNFDGQAFGARAVGVKVFDNLGFWRAGGNYYRIWDLAYDASARVNNNSWGSRPRGGYFASDSDADAITWDNRDYVLAVAAGNDGVFGPTTVLSPACSKNAITVGATDNGTGAAPENVAFFSSRGPTNDERIKPDVMAPGNTVTSARRGVANGYIAFAGTSMATPQVSGSAALVREYFMRGFYPTGAAVPGNTFTPSAALVKAVLINGGKEMTGARADWNLERKWPNNAQGWGRVDLDRSLYFAGDARRLMVWDSPQNLQTGQVWTGRFRVFNELSDAKVTLTWTDREANAGAGVTLVNDLDLTVIAPDGRVFLGNSFPAGHINPGHSVVGGAADRRNTVEGVHLVPRHSFPGNLPVGTYKVIVRAFNMAQPTSNFAVAVTGSVTPAPQLPGGRIGVMGDYSFMLRRLLEGWGYTVENYDRWDYTQVTADLSNLDVVILNGADNTSGFDTLYNAANTQQKGLIFAGTYPVTGSGMGVLQARKGSPSSVSNDWSRGAVVTRVLASHPVFNGYTVGQSVTLINGGDNDYQSYNGYNGTNLGANQMPTGGPYMVGVKDRAQTGGARHVVLGSLGACNYTNPSHWTYDGQRILFNAVEWARATSGTPPARTRVGVMGDYNDQVRNYLTSVGYVVTPYGPGDYTAVISNLNNLDAVVLHRVDDATGFTSLLSQAAATGRGLVFLSSYPVPYHGMGVLSSRQGSPAPVANDWGDGPVWILMLQNHPVFTGYQGGDVVNIMSGGDDDYQTYDTYNGTTIAHASMPDGYIGMIGVKDRAQTGGARHVTLGSFGACQYTNLNHWTPDAKRILKNAIDWARFGAP